jgi:hypothetical protein
MSEYEDAPLDIAEEEVVSEEKIDVEEKEVRDHSDPVKLGFRVESDEALSQARTLVERYEAAKLAASKPGRNSVEGPDPIRAELKASKSALNELRLVAPEAVAKARDEALEAIEAAKG